MQQDLLKKSAESAAHISEAADVACFVFDAESARVAQPGGAPRFCESCRGCDEMKTHLYTSNQAYLWNGSYICYCPIGLAFSAAALIDENARLLGALIAGPLVLGEIGDTLELIDRPDLAPQIAALPNRRPTQLTGLSEVMRAVAGAVTGVSSLAGAFVYEQDRVLNAIYEAQQRLMDDPQHSQPYPIDNERQLAQLIVDNDRAGAQKLLNLMLGAIYCSLNFDLERIKPRVMELVVIMSRATIDAGADINEIFVLNNSFMAEIEQFSSLDELSGWLAAVLNRFIGYSFDFAGIKHADVVFKVMDYVRNHYGEKISIEDIARQVGLSRSYLSRLFKEQTGQNIVEYIAKVRVDNAKKLLKNPQLAIADIALRVGFDDQSYFTKVFKRQTGLSPKAYRDSHPFGR